MSALESVNVGGCVTNQRQYSSFKERLKASELRLFYQTDHVSSVIIIGRRLRTRRARTEGHATMLIIHPSVLLSIDHAQD